MIAPNEAPSLDMFSFISFCCSTCNAVCAGVGPYVVVFDVQLMSALVPLVDVAVQLVFVVWADAADAKRITTKTASVILFNMGVSSAAFGHVYVFMRGGSHR